MHCKSITAFLPQPVKHARWRIAIGNAAGRGWFHCRKTKPSIQKEAACPVISTTFPCTTIGHHRFFIFVPLLDANKTLPFGKTVYCQVKDVNYNPQAFLINCLCFFFEILCKIVFSINFLSCDPDLGVHSYQNQNFEPPPLSSHAQCKDPTLYFGEVCIL